MACQTNAYRTKNWSKLLCAFLLSLLFCLPAKAEEGWRSLKEGMEYMNLGGTLLTPWSRIHVFRIDLNKNQLALVMAKSLAQKNATVEEYAQHSDALLAVNGGFFDRQFRPLGLRISNNKQESALKRISWWGIFYIKDNKPYLGNVRQFYQAKDIDFAIQSGPRLIIDNKIPSLKPGNDERSALGITKDGKIIILVTDNAPMTTTELAVLLKDPPLSCTDALNLDGGSSSQLHAAIGSFQMSVHGFSQVSDAVIVKEK